VVTGSDARVSARREKVRDPRERVVPVSFDFLHLWLHRARRYWSLVSPGIIIIRAVTLQPVKREAERRARMEEIRTS